MLALLLSVCHMLLKSGANTPSPSDPGLALRSLAHWKWHRVGALNHGANLQLRTFHVEWTVQEDVGRRHFCRASLRSFVLLKNKSQEISRLQLRRQASTSRNYYCSERLQVVHTGPSIYHRVSLLQ